MYMNINFGQDAGFSLYVVALLVLGGVLIAMATPAVPHVNIGLRAVNGILGVLMFGYGFYLAFLFHGGTYWIAIKALILPLVLIGSTIKAAIDGRNERKAEANMAAAAPVGPPVFGPQFAPGQAASDYGSPAPQGYGAPLNPPVMPPAPPPGPIAFQAPVTPALQPAQVPQPGPVAPVAPISPIEEVR